MKSIRFSFRTLLKCFKLRLVALIKNANMIYILKINYLMFKKKIVILLYFVFINF